VTAWRGHAAGAVVAVTSLVILVLLPYLPFPTFGGLVRTLLITTFILGSCWAILAVLGRVFEFLWPRDRSVAHARSTWKVVSYVTWFAIFVIMLFGFLPDLATTALGIGLLGAAFTFAMQKPLLNVAGWVVITYRQLYLIGDRVEVGGVKGYVVDIGLQTTELQEFGGWMPGDEFTGRVVEIPNCVVFDGPTNNYTRDFPFVWDDVDITVTYESDIDAAKEIAISSANEVVGGIMYDNFEKYRHALAIRDLEGSLLRTPEVRLRFAPSGVDLHVVYFVPVDRRGSLKTRLVEKLWRRFSEDPRVEIAYPHMQVVQPPKPKETVVTPKEQIVSPKGSDWLFSRPPGGH
jgi:small-conductance mechanosensitive channel